MPVFEVSSDLGAFSEEILRALQGATGESEVVGLETWMWCDKATHEVPVTPRRHGKVEVEWLRRKGQFGLDLRIIARDSCQRMSAAMFARAFAGALGRPLLFSDCHLFPWSYILAGADGSMFDVVCQPNDEDRLDLVAGDPDRPGDFTPGLLFAPYDALPAPLEGETFAPPDRCGVFGGACPKKSERCPKGGPFHLR